jgi:hypothetical protein
LYAKKTPEMISKNGTNKVMVQESRIWVKMGLEQVFIVLGVWMKMTGRFLSCNSYINRSDVIKLKGLYN